MSNQNEHTKIEDVDFAHTFEKWADAIRRDAETDMYRLGEVIFDITSTANDIIKNCYPGEVYDSRQFYDNIHTWAKEFMELHADEVYDLVVLEDFAANKVHNFFRPVSAEVTVPVDITIMTREGESEEEAKYRLHGLLKSELENLSDHQITCNVIGEHAAAKLTKTEDNNVLPVQALSPGTTVKYHQTPCRILEHRPEGTLLISLNAIKDIAFGETNNFATSKLREFLNGPYLDDLTIGQTDEIIARTVDLTDFHDSKKYGTCECKVAPLTLDELRKFCSILPPPECQEWSVTPWNIPFANDDHKRVVGLDVTGSFVDTPCTRTNECRPAFLIASNTVLPVISLPSVLV